MQSRGWWLVVAALSLSSVVAPTGRAQQYTLRWFKVAGGGGTASGGQYTVSSTAGQPDAGGPLNIGNYSFTGGFWSPAAVQTPGAPFLAITLNHLLATATLSWPAPSTGFVLQQTGNLKTPNWVNVPTQPTTNGDLKEVAVSPPVGDEFYRLVYPVPPLSVRLPSTNTVVLSWPAPSPGWVLQQKSDLSAPNWVTVPTVPMLVNGDLNEVTVSPVTGDEFYRLFYTTCDCP